PPTPHKEVVASSSRGKPWAPTTRWGTTRPEPAEPCREPEQASASGPLPACLGSYCVKPSARSRRWATSLQGSGRTRLMGFRHVREVLHVPAHQLLCPHANQGPDPGLQPVRDVVLRPHL